MVRSTGPVRDISELGEERPDDGEGEYIAPSGRFANSPLLLRQVSSP